MGPLEFEAETDFFGILSVCLAKKSMFSFLKKIGGYPRGSDHDNAGSGFNL